MAPMAADRHKRRLSSAFAISNGVQEQYKIKKQDFRSPQSGFNFNPHVLLKWDNSQKGVVARKEQIGLSWKHLRPFVPTNTRTNTVLGDVIELPTEVFGMKDLTKILSYEVWQSLLTDTERNFLMQFLPQGFEPDQVVKDLLGGDNFDFGNPSLKWSALICSGDLHPDAIVQHEKCLMLNKKAYYTELRQYHDNMIGNLQNLKKRFASSKDPESEIAQMSRIQFKNVMTGRHEKLTTITNRVKATPKPRKTKKLQMTDININSGSKYMSYIKVSKKQHELVRNMKQSGRTIQSKSLNRVLGNISAKPYGMFVEEEQKRIHEFWLNLANKDIPMALENWNNRKSRKRQIMNCLMHEIRDKTWFLMEEEKLNTHASKLVISHDEEMDKESSEQVLENHRYKDSAFQGSIPNDERSGLTPMHCQSPVNRTFAVNKGFKPSSMSIEMESSVKNATLNVNNEFRLFCVENQSSTHKPSLNLNKDFTRLDLNVESNNFTSDTSETHLTMHEPHTALQTNEACLLVPRSQHHSSAGVDAVGVSCSSMKNMWTSIGVPESYHNIQAAQYASTSEFPSRYAHVTSKPACVLIDLEADFPEEKASKDLLNKHPNHMQSLNSHTSQFHGHYGEHLQPSSASDNNLKEVCMNLNIPENLYSANRYSILGAGNLSTQNVRDRSNAHVLTPVQPIQSTSLLNHNWYASENQTLGGWLASSGTSFSSPCLGNVNNGVQSLKSVVSQCTNLDSRTFNNPMSSTEQVMPTTNHGQDMNGGISMTTNALLQTVYPFNYLGRSNAGPTTLNPNHTNLQWMSTGRNPSSTLPDMPRNLFLKPWKQ